MGATEKYGYLLNEISSQKSAFLKRRRRDKHRAFLLAMATVTLSAAITVLLGMHVSTASRQILANIALVLGALTTVLSTYEAFYNHRGLWIGRSITLSRIEDLERRVNYTAQDDTAEQDGRHVDHFMAELNRVIWEGREAWLRLRALDGAMRSPDYTPTAASIPTPS